jgi:hypothetical protein
LETGSHCHDFNYQRFQTTKILDIKNSRQSSGGCLRDGPTYQLCEPIAKLIYTCAPAAMPLACTSILLSAAAAVATKYLL